MTLPPAINVQRFVWRESGASEGRRSIPEETAVALTYNGGTYAVMMATPQDLEDFAVGFSLDEGVVRTASEIESLEVVPMDDGIELRMWLAQANADRLSERRRHIAGPTGCGLCGIDSIVEATRPATIVGVGRNFSPAQIMSAMQSLAPLQKLNTETRAVHAAAFWLPEQGIVSLREDVGRHNALDKLIGALVRNDLNVRDGFVLMTSRCSFELVQKTVTAGIGALVTVSAPTSLALELARKSNLFLAALAKGKPVVFNS